MTAAAMPDDPYPRITDIAPSRISPKGGTLVTITGANFVAPARVIFQLEDLYDTTYEAEVVSVTDTKIEVLAPAMNLRGLQYQDAGIFVHSAAGTENERFAVTYRNRLIMFDVLQPSIRTVWPNTGTILGGTHVGIFGEGFEPPVRVFFNNVEAKVVEEDLDLVSAIVPPSPSVRYAIIQVVNKANVTGVKFGAFQYVTPMSMTRIVPNEGNSNGGTTVKIQGDSFPEHVQVWIAGVYASVLKSTPTEITALTIPAFDPNCSDKTGNVRITNLDNYDVADNGPSFTFRATPPRFMSIGLIAGERSPVTLADAAAGTFTLGDREIALVFYRGTTNDVTKYELDVPKDFNFPLISCGDGSEVPAPFATTLTFRNQFTGCSTTANVLVRPPKDAPRCETHVRGPREKP